MLKFMRDHLGKTFLFIIVGMIAFVFVLWGVFPESRTGGMAASGSDVATIAGERITLQELNNAINRDIENYRALGMELPPELMNNIKMQTLQGLVQKKLMVVEARRLGIQASDKEVAAEIEQMPYFQNKDKKAFDVQLYRRLLTENNLSPGQFEENVREGLTSQRMVKFLENRIRVTPGEVEREFRIANEMRNLEFVRFSREDALKKMKVEAKELEAFLADKNKEAQVNSFYVQNNSRYNKPEQVCARHILKRFAVGVKATDSKEPPKDLLALHPTAQNFAKLAEKNSDDPGSKAKGGDLDCFPQGQMDKAFDTVAFSSAVGAVSAPVKTNFGWHYILVYKKTPALHRSLEVVKREIAEELMKRDRIEDIRKINLASGEEALKNWPPTGLDTTGPFNGLEGMIPKIGRAEEIMKVAFDPKAKIQSGPQLFEAAGGVIVAKVKEKKSADMAKLEQGRELQMRTLRERKLRQFLPAWLEDVQKRATVSYNKSVVNQL